MPIVIIVLSSLCYCIILINAFYSCLYFYLVNSLHTTSLKSTSPSLLAVIVNFCGLTNENIAVVIANKLKRILKIVVSSSRILLYHPQTEWSNRVRRYLDRKDESEESIARRYEQMCYLGLPPYLAVNVNTAMVTSGVSFLYRFISGATRRFADIK